MAKCSICSEVFGKRVTSKGNQKRSVSSLFRHGNVTVYDALVQICNYKVNVQ